MLLWHMLNIEQKGELNGTLIYLDSKASSYVIRQHIIIDGGMTIV